MPVTQENYKLVCLLLKVLDIPQGNELIDSYEAQFGQLQPSMPPVDGQGGAGKLIQMAQGSKPLPTASKAGATQAQQVSSVTQMQR